MPEAALCLCRCAVWGSPESGPSAGSVDRPGFRVGEAAVPARPAKHTWPVSYTHLTLPTICSV
eukprot:14925003-Alexandrium_andersonii.AAC.1